MIGKADLLSLCQAFASLDEVRYIEDPTAYLGDTDWG
jgi:hypothetical protein